MIFVMLVPPASSQFYKVRRLYKIEKLRGYMKNSTVGKYGVSMKFVTQLKYYLVTSTRYRP